MKTPSLLPFRLSLFGKIASTPILFFIIFTLHGMCQGVNAQINLIIYHFGPHYIYDSASLYIDTLGLGKMEYKWTDLNSGQEIPFTLGQCNIKYPTCQLADRNKKKIPIHISVEAEDTLRQISYYGTILDTFEMPDTLLYWPPHSRSVVNSFCKEDTVNPFFRNPQFEKIFTKIFWTDNGKIITPLSDPFRPNIVRDTLTHEVIGYFISTCGDTFITHPAQIRFFNPITFNGLSGDTIINLQQQQDTVWYHILADNYSEIKVSYRYAPAAFISQPDIYRNFYVVYLPNSNKGAIMIEIKPLIPICKSIRKEIPITVNQINSVMSAQGGSFQWVVTPTLLQIHFNDIISKGQLRLWTLGGKSYRNLTIHGESDLNISTEDLASGMYLIQIITPTNTMMQKIFIPSSY